VFRLNIRKEVCLVFLKMKNSSILDDARKKLCGRLYVPYQTDGVRWMLTREFDPKRIKGGFLCDEMGLGKTVQTITTMLGNPKNKTLIVCPKSVLNQWKDEIEHFAPGMSVLIYDRSKTIENQEIVLAPYSLMVERQKNTGTVFHQIAWDRIVLDEGHEIRNPQSKTFKSMNCIRSEIRWILSGTPVFNSMKDFVSLCQFLGIPKSVVQAHQEKVRTKFVLRRTKQDVCKFNKRLGMPPCEFENVELEMHEEEQKLYDTVFAESVESIHELCKTDVKVAMKNMHILECFLRCRQVMSHPQIYLNSIYKKTGTDFDTWEHQVKKTEKLLEFIKTHPKEKSLVFCQFTSEMNIIRDLLSDEGIKTFRIDGSVSSEDRSLQIKQFGNFLSGCVFIIQIKSGGVGLNLQAATRVYITSPSWNPATELQAIARSHRTGQSQKVIVKKLIYKCDRSIEKSIMKLQDAKSIVCAEVLNDERILKQLPKLKSGDMIRDLKNIFQE
jgi:SNF2 family DNA or RNA helicase